VVGTVFASSVAALAIFLATSCEDDETSCVPDDQCGIVCNQATVVFQTGTQLERVDEINAEIGATVIMAPILSTAYRVQLLPGMGFDEAQDFYMSKTDDVVAVLWATNYCPQGTAAATGGTSR